MPPNQNQNQFPSQSGDGGGGGGGSMQPNFFEGIELGDGNNSGNGDDDDAPIITTDWLSLMGSGPGYE